jgi:hypothetical protein
MSNFKIIRPSESETIYAELQKLVASDTIEYVVPTNPLGEQWVIGIDGEIVKLIGDVQAKAFLIGIGAAARRFARAQGLLGSSR